MIIRLFGYRLSQVRKMSFKRPPPDYIYKREVVPSDLDGSKLNKHQFDCENEKWTTEIENKIPDICAPKDYFDDVFQEQNSRED